MQIIQTSKCIETRNGAKSSGRWSTQAWCDDQNGHVKQNRIFYIKVRYDEKWPHETHIDEDTIDVKETMTTRKKVFWNHFSTMMLPPPRPTTTTMMTKKMVNSFIKRQFVLSLAIILVFMLQGTTEEAAIVSKVPR